MTRKNKLFLGEHQHATVIERLSGPETLKKSFSVGVKCSHVVCSEHRLYFFGFREEGKQTMIVLSQDRPTEGNINHRGSSGLER